jgi:rhodanese-related sulfurtransferase
MKLCCEFETGRSYTMIDDREQFGRRPLAVLMMVLLVVAGAAGCSTRKSEPPSPAPRVGVGGSTAAAPAPAGDYRNLGPEEFQVYWQSHPGGLLLDVRQPDEWDDELGHLEGAVLIPDDEVRARLDELPADPNTSVMVYCKSGRRSSRVAWELFLEGYTTIINLDGGLTAYRDEIY